MNPDVAGYLFLVLAATVLLLLELAAGMFGVILPATAVIVLYAAQTRSRRTTLVLAFVSGVVLDLVCGRDFPISVPALLLGGLIAAQSRRREVVQWLDLLLPVLGGMAGYQAVLLCSAWLNGGPYLTALSRFCGVSLWGTGMALLIFAALDCLGKWLGLNMALPYRSAGGPRNGRTAGAQERS